MSSLVDFEWDVSLVDDLWALFGTTPPKKRKKKIVAAPVSAKITQFFKLQQGAKPSVTAADTRLPGPPPASASAAAKAKRKPRNAARTPVAPTAAPSSPAGDSKQGGSGGAAPVTVTGDRTAASGDPDIESEKIWNEIVSHLQPAYAPP